MRTWMILAPVTLAIAAAGCGETRPQKATTGAAGGALAGAVVGGPVGALVGAGIGGAGGAFREELTPGADRAVGQAFNTAEQQLQGESSGTTGAAIEPASPSAARSSARQAGDLTNDEVREAQTALKEMGLYEGPVDGIYGRQTIVAVRQFQTRRDMRLTGALDDQTQRAIQTASEGGTTSQQQTTQRDSGQSQPAQEPSQAQSEQQPSQAQSGQQEQQAQSEQQPSEAPSGRAAESETRGATGAAIEPPERAQAAGGITRAEIREAQTALKDMGLYEGQIDGIIGPRTQEAVRQFQAKNDLQRTGTLDQQTLEQLQVAASGRGAGQQRQPSGGGQPQSEQPPPAEPRYQPGAGGSTGQ